MTSQQIYIQQTEDENEKTRNEHKTTKEEICQRPLGGLGVNVTVFIEKKGELIFLSDTFYLGMVIFPRC